MKWKNIEINKNLIKAETCRAVLINCPHSSNYDGFSFWHPASLVRDAKQRDKVSLSYTDDFIFRLKKHGKGRYNSHSVIREIELSSEELESIFSYLSPQEEKPLVFTPETLTPVKSEVLEELLDD